MMFAAGLGAGLLFYGTAEPVSHWTAPPHGLAEPQTEEAALVALRYTYFHWGFNGWAMYAVMGGAMAYFSFRKGLPTLVSATFTPLLGPNATTQPLGRLVDALAIVATLFGTATALGLNGLQLNSGLEYLFDVPKSNAVAVMIIVVVTALFLISATSGVEKGINFLANLGSFATIGLFLFFLVVGGVDGAGHLAGHRVDRQLHHPGAADVAADRRRRRAVDGRLDDLLLGLVDLLGALRRHVRRPDLARPDDPRVRDRRGRGADRVRLPVVRRRRRHRHRAAAHRPGRHRRLRWPPPSCRCSPRSTCCRSRCSARRSASS